MNGLYAVLITAGVLLLIGCIRVGVQVEYCGQGLFVRVRLGRFYITVFPAKKADKPKKNKKAVAAEKAPKKEKKGGKLQQALDFIPLILDTAKRFFRKLQVDKLDMELVICTSDPADTAVQYGRANALLGSIWQPVTEVFRVKDGHAHVGVDFEGNKPTLYVLATLSLTIGQLLCLVSVFGMKALGILIRTRTNRKKQTQQGEAV